MVKPYIVLFQLMSKLMSKKLLVFHRLHWLNLPVPASFLREDISIQISYVLFCYSVDIVY